MYYDLALAEYDVPGPSGPARAQRSYLLCSNPRSGSTLLSEALHGLGNLGSPIEYFDGTDAMAACADRWGCENLRCYVACLHRNRTTRDGLLAAKVHWYQLQEMTVAMYVEAPPQRYARQRAALNAVFPHCRYVYVIREDRDRQAVSWMIARETGRWTTLMGPGDPPPVEYDFDAIDACRVEVEEAEAGWLELFEAEGVEPLTVTYEQLAGDYEETVAAVARFVGSDITAADVPAPRLRKQSTQHNRRLLERYRADRAARR